MRCLTSKLERRNSPHLGGDVGQVVEFWRGFEKSALGVDQRNAMMRMRFRGPQARTPSAISNSSHELQSKKLEEAAVEHDARRVAMTPFDGELPAVDEICHAWFRLHALYSWSHFSAENHSKMLPCRRRETRLRAGCQLDRVDDPARIGRVFRGDFKGLIAFGGYRRNRLAGTRAEPAIVRPGDDFSS